ncbi:hypothetical protein [Kangiella sediminilitoris]|uniref:Membrane protein n=1 Tax=Kangiella sediminilitoris TaxID=1144748 RepID=A0A1B3BC01_9GAMM|nr:hypothetical protein [Kangiella sediminilitoris]AOE50322.1 membrane protein [Kangiella sediminilitoris]
MKISKTLRVTYWIIAVFILLVPAIAMQFTNEVNWGLYDFLLMAALLIVTGVAIELAIRMTVQNRYRAAIIFAILLAFLMIWAELAVGII